jgi:hypothetical protein
VYDHANHQLVFEKTDMAIPWTRKSFQKRYGTTGYSHAKE